MVSPIIDMRGSNKHSGNSGRPTQLLVIHSGECPLRGGYAQSLTDWAKVPLEQGGPEASWTWFVDPIAIVYMIDAALAAWHASEANPISEGLEQAGYARMSRAEWTTAEGLKQFDNLGWLIAQRCKVNGIPAQWLTTDQVTAITSGRDTRTKGLCLHRQIDPETRTDPGDNYPFDLLTAAINKHLAGDSLSNQGGDVTPITPSEEEDFFMSAQGDLAIKKLDENRRHIFSVNENVSNTKKDIATVHNTVIAVGKVVEQALAQAVAGRADLATVHTTIINDVGGQLGQHAAQLAALQDVIEQVLAGQGQAIDWDRLAKVSEDGAARGIAAAVKSITRTEQTTVDILTEDEMRTITAQLADVKELTAPAEQLVHQEETA